MSLQSQTSAVALSRAQLHHRNISCHKDRRKHMYKDFGYRKSYHGTVLISETIVLIAVRQLRAQIRGCSPC